ncbi:MAG: FprA family A-type flavoprotein [Acidobacteriota bacterium]|jgi:flavorubredoxin|nr:FprA family A-type flavoprotein [Acidobacteriota bacterium]NLT33453.1 FprA family A-type flavoprotein [Acidobacteriota bacterium]
MLEIREGVFWTGAIDWNLRMFHGYSIPAGTTYNAYLLRDELPTLIDTVKHYGFPEMLGRIREVIDPREIRYIVSNHTEMDHSGAIDRLLQYCPEAEVVCSPKGAEELRRHYKRDWRLRVVQGGDTLDIGSRRLRFVMTPMVHWPDSMVTYSETDRILFPNDAFGQHYASHERFADEVPAGVVDAQAAKYYGNIVLPYGNQVVKALEAVGGLDIDMIAPSHGLIWRRPEDIARITGLYARWAAHQTDPRVVIVYDTMWHSTEAMARRLYECFTRENVPVVLMSLQATHISDVVTEILRSRMALFGTPILNSRMLPTMAGMLMYLKGLKPKKRLSWTFGSYGWSPIGFKEVEASLKEAGFEPAGEGKYIPFVPDEAELESLADAVAMLKAKLSA